MGLIAQKLEERRAKTIRRAIWHRKQPRYAQGKAVRSLDELERQIDAMHDEIAALLHERNARPKDPEVKGRIEDAVERLRQLEIEYADQADAHCTTDHAVPP